MSKYSFRLYPDYAGLLWEGNDETGKKYGNPANIADLPIDSALTRELIAFEKHLCDTFGHVATLRYQPELKAKGEMLLAQLRHQLGDNYEIIDELIGTDPFVSDSLWSLPSINHGFFTRNGGVSEGVFANLNCAHGTGDTAENVDENFRRIQESLQAEALVKAYQVHGTEVAVATEAWTLSNRPHADAIVTDVPGLAISITTADCAPVLFADAKAGIIGAAHAGWKGAIAGVTDKTIEAMEALGATRAHIHAAIGPCIHQKSYEVDAAFRMRFLNQTKENAAFFIPSDKEHHFRFDLPGYVLARLKAARIGSVNLLAHDTAFEEDRFFSYRRATLRGESAYGCQLSAIVLTH